MSYHKRQHIKWIWKASCWGAAYHCGGGVKSALGWVKILSEVNWRQSFFYLRQPMFNFAPESLDCSLSSDLCQTGGQTVWLCVSVKLSDRPDRGRLKGVFLSGISCVCWKRNLGVSSTKVQGKSFLQVVASRHVSVSASQTRWKWADKEVSLKLRKSCND